MSDFSHANVLFQYLDETFVVLIGCDAYPMHCEAYASAADASAKLCDVSYTFIYQMIGKLYHGLAP